MTHIPLPEAEVRSLTAIDPWLTRHVADWAVILGLHQYSTEKIHGFITNDDSMLALSRTLPVLMKTDLTLLVCAAVGHDPVAATGLLLLHLPYVARRWAPGPELVVVQRPQQKSNELNKFLTEAALRHNLAPGPFRKQFEPTPAELSTPLKQWYSPGTP